MRAFIAIELPSHIQKELAKIEEELKQADADVKWVKPGNLHLTLKFLGEIDEKKAQQISDLLKEITRNTPSFELTLTRVGAFPKKQYPRVIWVEAENHLPLVKIFEELEKQLLKLGFAKESRPFQSHITLGRLRSPKNRQGLIEKLNLIAASEEKFLVQSLVLFKSTLTAAGPIYEPRHIIPLNK